MPTADLTSPGGQFSDAVVQLRRRHYDLVRQNLSSPITRDTRSAFIAELAASGRELEARRDRDAVRKLLYYWTADAISCGEQRKEQSPPPLQAYESEGVSATPAGTTTLTAESSVEDIEATTADVRASIRIATLARQWLASGKNDGYLLNGEALVEAERLADSDPDLQALVDASKAQAHRSERRFRYALFGLSVLFAALAIATTLGWIQERSASAKLKASVDELQGTQNQLKDRARQLEDANSTLKALNEQASQEIRNRTRAALDALRRGKAQPTDPDPLQPLKDLLKQLGNAQENELERLDYRPPDAATAASDRVTDTGLRPQATTQIESIGTCAGAIWLGSEAAKLVTFDGRLDSLHANQTVTIKSSVTAVRLRKALPPQTYVMPPQVGLIPGGAVVTLTGEPVSYNREGGVQLFAPVKVPYQFCTRVFIQFGGPAEKAEALRSELGDLGVQVPPAQKLDKVPAYAEVRYFYKVDEAVAKLVTAKLRAVTGKDVQERELANFPTKPPTGTLEVWIDLDP